ncbi:hypothetical protein IJG78_00675 [Candidatus Saccharibacteria bacterium]|nr:hypothetical protein [Candidatus Saccharibacteria bacterium]
MVYLAILGRQAKLSVAELESLFSDVTILSPKLALFTSKNEPEINRLGGVIKLAKEITEEKVEDFLLNTGFDGKFVIGVSDYSKKSNSRKAWSTALRLKKILKKSGKSVRILENKEAILSSATVFHNQLGEKPGHIEIIKYGNRFFYTFGVQNINAYAARDRERPARDAKVGMLPPKLAQILINLCGDLPAGTRILDPFCGTGVVLQEALLSGYAAYGTDVSSRMVEYTKKNLDWLKERQDLPDYTVTPGDATNCVWEQPIEAVACETYLGPPMSNPPAEIKLKEVSQECHAIITGFLKNLATQIESGTPVVIAVPAWLRPDGTYFRLKILDEVDRLGYNVMKYKNLSQEDLLYARAGQVVAREIIHLRKK